MAQFIGKRSNNESSEEFDPPLSLPLVMRYSELEHVIGFHLHRSQQGVP
jgi:hypothetical protein